MFITACKIDGIDFKLDYEKIAGDDTGEYNGILHVRNPIAFIFNENSFSPPGIDQTHKDGIKQAIRMHEDPRQHNELIIFPYPDDLFNRPGIHYYFCNIPKIS
jgi:hypothetical protein